MTGLLIVLVFTPKIREVERARAVAGVSTRIRKENVVNERDGSGRPFDVEENSPHHAPPLRDERSPEADRFKFLVDSAVGIRGRPAGRILEEANAADLFVGAQVKPVQ